ncbi:MAG: hypothetical protein DRN71_03770 [Candidatus Nanohalarchaeota archaeon]|nr:MAG: hypothetical protein DRN71_03770 [Candidatus Nanohaloarchaeota archaeon]
MQFKIISSIIIALVAVILLFAIVQMYSTESTTSMICKLHKNVIRHIPLPGYANQPLPDGCSEDPIEERIEIKEMTNSELSHYIVKCWKKAKQGMYGKKLECYELYAKKTTEHINESTVTATFNSEQCDFISNNWLDIENESYSCGTENKIMWKMTETIENKTTIILKYNPLAHWVEVI